MEQETAKHSTRKAQLQSNFQNWNAKVKQNVDVRQISWSRRDVTAYITFTIKPEILRILHHDIWGTVSVFIVERNADIRGGFTNLTADYQKLRLEIGVGI